MLLESGLDLLCVAILVANLEMNWESIRSAPAMTCKCP